VTTQFTVRGEPAHPLGDRLSAVTFPYPISADTADQIKHQWHKAVSGKSRLVILDRGAQLFQLHDDPGTPIYDALAREYGWVA
jgi:hypothetical protein